MTYISIREWRDKKNGNTYHTVRTTVSPNGESIAIDTSPMTLGDGTQWQNTFAELAGLSYSVASRFLTSSLVITEKVQVSRRKDLHSPKIRVN